MKVLVGYATANGSTREVARHIATRLEKLGLDVEFTAVGETTQMDGVDAVVIGSAIHSGQWLPEATAFVATHRDALSMIPAWFFSVCTIGDTTSFLGPTLTRMARRRRRLPYAVADLVSVQTSLTKRTSHTTHIDHHRWFAGVIAEDAFGRFGNAFLRLAGGKPGDRRDWHDIDAWTDRLSTQIEYLHLRSLADR